MSSVAPCQDEEATFRGSASSTDMREFLRDSFFSTMLHGRDKHSCNLRLVSHRESLVNNQDIVLRMENMDGLQPCGKIFGQSGLCVCVCVIPLCAVCPARNLKCGLECK